MLAKEGVLTPGMALLESAIIEAGRQSAREFSAAPDDQRVLKARFFSVQKDALRVEGRGEALTPPQVFGFTWEENGEKKALGIDLPSSLKEKGGRVILDGQMVRTLDPRGGPSGYEHHILKAEPLEAFFASRGVEIHLRNGAITGEALKKIEAAGFKPVTASIRTGDFLPVGVQERLIPARLIFDGVQGAAAGLDRLDDILETVTARVRHAVEETLKSPDMQAKIDEIVQRIAPGDQVRQGEERLKIIQGEVDMHLAAVELTLGANVGRALVALRDYLESRQQFHRSAVADPFQVELGRGLTALLGEAGFAKRPDPRSGKRAEPILYQRLDQLLNKAHERYANLDHIRCVGNPMSRHPLVMIEAMKEMKRVLAYFAREGRVPGWSITEEGYQAVMSKPVKVPGLSDERLDQALGEGAQQDLANQFVRAFRTMTDRGRTLTEALSGLMADGIVQAMRATGQLREEQTSIARTRVQVKLGGKDDLYEDRAARIGFNGKVEVSKALPKPAFIASIDKTIDAFMAVDRDGRWVNSTLRELTEDPLAVKREVVEASDRLAQELNSGRPNILPPSRATRALQMARAREAFKVVDMLQASLEDSHFRPSDALRLPKALGAITRDSREDDLKATMPYTATTPVVEEGRIYIAPVKDIAQGEAYMVINLERDLSGTYVQTSREEIATGQLARVLDEANQRDIRVEVLRHGLERGLSLVEVLERFSVYPIGGNRYLVNMQVGDSGKVAEALGFDFRGSYWPEARLDRTKPGFSLQASDQGGGLAVGIDGEREVAPGAALQGPHVYIRVRDDESSPARLVYFQVPQTQAQVVPCREAFLGWLDARARSRPQAAALGEVLDRFRLVAQSHFTGLMESYLDGRAGGTAALSPKFQAGVMEPDLFGMSFFPGSERKAGDRPNPKQDPNAIRALENLIHLRSLLGAQVDLHAIQA